MREINKIIKRVILRHFKNKFSFLFVFLSLSFISFGQKKEAHNNDSTQVNESISEVTVNAFEKNKKITDQPVPVSHIGSKELSRFNNLNIISAMNNIPGVRMEERSPGSIRLNFRGSTVRSPFGIRDVKIYYNGIPFTDPGGNTYLNQLSFQDYGSIEAIKGPSGSIYGAGTGGTMIIEDPLFAEEGLRNKVEVGVGLGSFGLHKEHATVRWSGENTINELRFTNAEKDGYRDHTKFRRQTASYSTRFKISEKESLDGFFHYTNLFYQTPGALTQSEFESNPKASRPSSGVQPSSEEAEAAVHQNAFVAGIRHNYYFTSNFKNTTTLYGSYTDFINPTTRNYEFRKEPHFGGRTVFEYKNEGKKVNSNYWVGAEAQQGYFDQQDYGNNKGTPDTLQTTDRTNQFNLLVFAQGEWSFPHDWDLSAAISLNHQKLSFNRLYPELSQVSKDYPLVFAPRVSLSKKFSPNLLTYINVSKGFSPPTVSEYLPSTNVLNEDLHAEKGMNYEIGSKGYFFKNKLYYDVSAFVTDFTESISQRRADDGADYFVNAGGSWKKGLELLLNYNFYENSDTFLTHLRGWLNQTIFDFRYDDYVNDDKDYSKNKIPGTAPYTLVSGLDLEIRNTFEANLTLQHSSKIPLDDANDVKASSYNLLGVNFSYQHDFGHNVLMNASVGGDNLLNEKYSLGNDVNAFGGRYFNAAPTINFYANIGFEYNF